MCSKPIFCSKVAKKDKICSRLLELQKIVPNAKSCSKVAEHNRGRPTYDVKLPNSTSYGERGYVTQEFCFSFPNLDAVLENSLTVERLRRWNESLKFETVRIHFLQWRFRCQKAWSRIWVLKACSRLQHSEAEQDREKVRENCVGAGERPSSEVVLSSFSLLSSRRFSIVIFITARSPFFARLHRPRALHMLTY